MRGRIKFCLVAEWPPFGKKLPTWLTIFSLRILTNCKVNPVLIGGIDLGSDSFSS